MKYEFEKKNFDYFFLLIDGNHEILYPKLESVLPIEHSIYFWTASFQHLVPIFLNLKIFHGPFGQSNMHSKLDFCPRLARQDMNVLLHKRS